MEIAIIMVPYTIRSNGAYVCLNNAGNCENTYSFRQLVPLTNDVDRFFVSYIACSMCQLAEDPHQINLFTVKYTHKAIGGAPGPLVQLSLRDKIISIQFTSTLNKITSDKIFYFVLSFGKLLK